MVQLSKLILTSKCVGIYFGCDAQTCFVQHCQHSVEALLMRHVAVRPSLCGCNLQPYYSARNFVLQLQLCQRHSIT